MKKILLFLLLSIPAGLSAQTTAMDFTKTDCNTGASHTLFSELEAGDVIIMEFVMIPSCTPCIEAYTFMEPVVNSYAAAYPGRVKVYQIAYNNAYTCTSLNSWATTNSMTSTRFIQGASEVAYYGGMGMPTVVVAAGTSHTVFGKWIGFLESDTTAFRNAIDAALADIASGTPEVISEPQWTIYPTATNESIRITLNGFNEFIQTITVKDLSGKTFSGNDILSKDINISSLSDGIYFIGLTTASGRMYHKKFQVIR
jgi:thiol-disulfide isomerase/thioredoxin